MATRATIRTAARVRADQDASTFPTDTQYNVFIDEAAKEVWFDLIQAGWPINFTSVNKTATGSAFLALGVSGTVAFIRGVFYYNGTTYEELRRLHEGDRASLLSVPGASSASCYDYRIDPTSGPGVELLPHVSSGTYRIDYITEHPGFSADGDVWYGPARSDELVSLRAAIKGCRKENNDQAAAQLQGEYSQLLSQVQAQASWADMRNAATIRHVGNQFATRDAFDYDVDPNY